MLEVFAKMAASHLLLLHHGEYILAFMHPCSLRAVYSDYSLRFDILPDCVHL